MIESRERCRLCPNQTPYVGAQVCDSCWTACCERASKPDPRIGDLVNAARGILKAIGGLTAFRLSPVANEAHGRLHLALDALPAEIANASVVPELLDQHARYLEMGQEAEREAQQRDAEIERLRVAVRSANGKATDAFAVERLARESLDEARAEAATLRAELAAKDAELADLRGQLEIARATLRQLGEECKRLADANDAVLDLMTKGGV